jgi:hypothetical protein
MMHDIYIKRRTKGVSKGEQKRLDILIRDFEKLEDRRKDYIRKLTRKLADIHCGGELLNKRKVGGVYT